MNTASRLISPRATRSRRSINSLWCGAGSYPQYRHHSIRLLRMRRRFSRVSAAMAGEISGSQNLGSVVAGRCVKLGFVILCRSNNVHQLLVRYVIHVFAEFPIGCTSRRACSGLHVHVLNAFDDGALRSDVALRCGRDLATEHGLQCRHLLDCAALANSEQAIRLLPDECLGTLSVAMPPFPGWIAGSSFAETSVNRRFSVPDRGASRHPRSLFLCAHRHSSSATIDDATRSWATSSKLVPLTATGTAQ